MVPLLSSVQTGTWDPKIEVSTISEKEDREVPALQKSNNHIFHCTQKYDIYFGIVCAQKTTF